MSGSVRNPATHGVLNYLREAHQHQQGEEIGAFERLWQLLNAVVGEGSDHAAPLRAGIQTVQDICHSARPIQTYTAVTHSKKKHFKWRPVQSLKNLFKNMILDKCSLVLPV